MPEYQSVKIGRIISTLMLCRSCLGNALFGFDGHASRAMAYKGIDQALTSLGDLYQQAEVIEDALRKQQAELEREVLYGDKEDD